MNSMVLRERMRRGDVLIGSWINTGSSVVAELMAQAGFDYLVIEAEHSAVDLSQIQLLCQAIEAGCPECATLIRMPGNSYEATKRYLDAGAVGVIAPLINTRAEAELLVQSVKYPPEGRRGVGYGRSHGYGFAFDDYMARANNESVVCVQIEHADAVSNVDEIVAVAGIDAVMIGPYDLTASMGITGQFEHPDYLEAVDKIRNACGRALVCPGVHVVQPQPQAVTSHIQNGFRFIGYSLDITMLGMACREGLRSVQHVQAR